MVEKIEAKDYAARFGFTEELIVERLQSGVLKGIEVNGRWFVLRETTNDTKTIDSHDVLGGSAVKMPVDLVKERMSLDLDEKTKEMDLRSSFPQSRYRSL